MSDSEAQKLDEINRTLAEIHKVLVMLQSETRSLRDELRAISRKIASPEPPQGPPSQP